MEEWDLIFEIREMVLKALEIESNKKTIGNSLEAKVNLTYPRNYNEVMDKFKEQLPAIFIVSQVETREGDEWKAEVLKAEGEKCQRCWNFSPNVGKDKDFPDLCDRCTKVIKALQ